MTHRTDKFAAWDVVRVASPFADSTARRNRPGLVISAPNVHERFGFLWVLMITSANRSAWPGDVRINDLRVAGLPVPCVIRTAKIATIDARLAEPVGHLSERDRVPVIESIRGILTALL